MALTDLLRSGAFGSLPLSVLQALAGGGTDANPDDGSDEEEEPPVVPEEEDPSETIARAAAKGKLPKVPAALIHPSPPVSPAATPPAGPMASPGPPRPWQSAIGNAVRGAVAAGATPNVAGGGPTDILRGLQAGMGTVQQQNMIGPARARQAALDDLNRRKVEAQIATETENAASQKEQREATADLRKAQAAKANVTPDPHKGMVQIPTEWAKKNLPEVAPDANGEYWLPHDDLRTLLTKPKPTPPTRTYEQHLVSILEDPSATAQAKTVADAELKAIHNKPDKPEKDITPEHVAAAIAVGIDSSKPVSAWTKPEAQAFQKELARQAQAVHVNVGTSGAPLTPDTLDMAAEVYLKTGNLPPMGMGTAGAAYRAQVLNRAADKLKTQGGGDVAANKALYDQLKSTGTQLQRTRANVLAFEATANKNLDLAQGLSQKVGRSGSPILNRWILAAKGQIAGDADTQAFEAAVQTAVNEYAKVVTNNGATGSVTDSARNEYRRILSSATNPQAFSQIVALLKQEMGNRRAGFDQQVQETNQKLREIGTGGGSNGGDILPGGITLQDIDSEIARRKSKK